MSCSRPYFSNKYLNFYGRPVEIACRSCECCRADRNAMWTERAKYEFSRFGVGAFVTFTYDDEHLPIADGFSHPTLDYSHYHKYIDSVRHRAAKLFDRYPNKYFYSDKNFTYLGCAEYGDKFERPHIHILFFGLDFRECAQFLKKSWRYGSIQVKPIKKGAYNYVVKYLQKQVFGKLLDELYYDKGCLPPKLFFSRGFGRGLYYDNVDIFRKYGYIKKGNKRINVPLYYAQKMFVWTDDWLWHLDNMRMEEEFKAYRHYQRMGGLMNFSTWKMDNRKVREYKLRKASFYKCSDTALVPLDVPRYDFGKIFSDMELGNMIDEVHQYGDLVPF